jgi:hypothetical protein
MLQKKNQEFTHQFSSVPIEFRTCKVLRWSICIVRFRSSHDREHTVDMLPNETNELPHDILNNFETTGRQFLQFSLCSSSLARHDYKNKNGNP